MGMTKGQRKRYKAALKQAKENRKELVEINARRRIMPDRILAMAREMGVEGRMKNIFGI